MFQNNEMFSNAMGFVDKRLNYVLLEKWYNKVPIVIVFFFN